MFNQIIRKIHSFLVENGIAETFRYIKSLDTVEISGISKNGKERVLLYDVLDEYGNDIVVNDIGFKYLIPCIPEGVIKSRTQDGIIYYTHFQVTYQNEHTFGLEIKEYHFCENIFHLRYIITINEISNAITEKYLNEIEVKYSGVKQFLLDAFTKEELEKYFSNDEMKMLIALSKKDDQYLNRDVDIIISYIISTFQAINFLSSYNNNTQNNRKVTKTTIVNANEYMNTIPIRSIEVNKYYIYKEGKKNENATPRQDRKIIRKTDKWVVRGHVRQYKSGKVTYVKSYYKGPHKELNEKPKTIFKVENTNIL